MWETACRRQFFFRLCIWGHNKWIIISLLFPVFQNFCHSCSEYADKPRRKNFSHVFSEKHTYLKTECLQQTKIKYKYFLLSTYCTVKCILNYQFLGNPMPLMYKAQLQKEREEKRLNWQWSLVKKSHFPPHTPRSATCTLGKEDKKRGGETDTHRDFTKKKKRREMSFIGRKEEGEKKVIHQSPPGNLNERKTVLSFYRQRRNSFPHTSPLPL